jgi:small-conductance mechanosensitive channel
MVILVRSLPACLFLTVSDRTEMRTVITAYYKEKRAVESGLRDLSTTVGKLDNVFLTFSAIVLLLVWLAIFGISINAYLVTAGSLIITTSFVIGNSAKNVFEAIIFIFILHPFDVGDKIEVDGVKYNVIRMGLMVSVLHRTDGQGATWH